MENASKALLMAGGVLMALLVLGALLLMFNNLSNYQESNVQNAREAEIIKFNNQFATYDRDNVRGNELYSLLNSVINYNLRKTIEGDEGAIEIGYQPMTVTFTLKSSIGDNYKSFAMDPDNPLLFKQNDYVVEKNTNTFQTFIENQLSSIEAKYGKQALTKLATGITKIFIEDDETQIKKTEAVNTFKKIVTVKTIAGKNVEEIKFEDLAEGTTIRTDIYTYYEFVQFKRAKFDCTNCKYDPNTGRIIQMDFKFNGKFE